MSTHRTVPCVLWEATQAARVSGALHDADGLPIADIEIKLGDQTVKTNGNGEFSFFPIMNGEYNLIATTAGYETYNQAITVNGNNVDSVDIILEKIKAPEPITTVDIPKTGNCNSSSAYYAIMAISACYVLLQVYIASRRKAKTKRSN